MNSRTLLVAAAGVAGVLGILAVVAAWQQWWWLAAGALAALAGGALLAALDANRRARTQRRWMQREFAMVHQAITAAGVTAAAEREALGTEVSAVRDGVDGARRDVTAVVAEMQEVRGRMAEIGSDLEQLTPPLQDVHRELQRFTSTDVIGTVRLLQAQYVGRLDRLHGSVEDAVQRLEQSAGDRPPA